ncbi:RNA polymerase sigma factor [Actinoplanes sp. SE50]|uniref:sigma-70 family RNA polymerase sigma factor n=1 Tax=unclassified Actinoplanes TaxID=2626549 RepID=UPI00023EC257|nr:MULTISPECIES: sigma-70 family RNA polymerase sigma factor [unclassified Actinoplanes]AEV83553.1 RNA polymerase sigma factor rpoD [Actinoplanes sp. SE50/110]ATO82303.1 RNA polymerase sigma factor [Actinoplanes sp. SE50]SLL99710.1 RNA polymerase sigma factor [Actinoplanes sp. SE50/110]
MRDLDRLEPLEDLDLMADRYAHACERADCREQRRLRERFVREALPFAGRLARRYRGRGEPTDDLVQVARLGLIKTVDRFDPQRGSFTAYAILTITGEIKRHFRDHTWGVHVPRGQQDRVLEFVHARAELTSELARTPTLAELAERLGLDETQVRGAQTSAAAHNTESLNVPLGDTGSEAGDLIGDVDGDLSLVDDRTTVESLLCELPARERRLLALRFWGNLSQVEIADELGISQMHVSRLLSRTLSWLREAMLTDVTPPWAGAGAPEHLVLATAVPDGVRADVRGEIDRDNANQVRRDLMTAAGTCGRGRRLTVDLSGVPLLSAAGIGMLTAVYEVARQREVRMLITGVQPYVARVLAISGLGELLVP